MQSLLLSSNPHLSLSGKDRLQHTFLSGIPGNGVMIKLSDFILADIENSQKVIVLDLYGDLSKELSEKAKVIPVGKDSLDLNLFTETNSAEVSENLMELFYSLYDPRRQGIIGPRFEHAIRNAIATIMYTNDPSFVNLIRVLTDESYVKEILPSIADTVVKNYWTQQIAQTSDFHKSETLDYIISKVSPFVMDEHMRKTLSEKSENTISHVLEEQKSLVCDFSLFYENKNTRRIITAVFMKKLLQTIKKHSLEAVLYIEELTFWPEEALTELLIYGKRYGVALVCSTMYPTEVSETLRRHLLRCGTLISFRQGLDDAKLLAPYFLGNVTSHDLCLLKKYHAYVKTIANGEITHPHLINYTHSAT